MSVLAWPLALLSIVIATACVVVLLMARTE